jgi:hypothetical protein
MAKDCNWSFMVADHTVMVADKRIGMLVINDPSGLKQPLVLYRSATNSDDSHSPRVLRHWT